MLNIVLVNIPQNIWIKYGVPLLNTIIGYVLMSNYDVLSTWQMYVVVTVVSLIEVFWIVNDKKINKAIFGLILPIHFISFHTTMVGVVTFTYAYYSPPSIGEQNIYIAIITTTLGMASLMNIVYFLYIRRIKTKYLCSFSNNILTVEISILTFLIINALKFNIAVYDVMLAVAHITLGVCIFGIICGGIGLFLKFNLLDNQKMFLEQELDKKEMYKKLLLGRSITVIEVDLNQDSINFYMNNNILTPNYFDKSYSELVENELSLKVYEPDRKKVIERCSPNYMTKIYENGIDIYEIEYRNEIMSNNYSWVRAMIHINKRIIGNQFIAVMSIIDINDEKERENSLLNMAERDAFTGLYNKTATIKLITHYLQNNRKGILFIIDLDNFKNVNDKISHSTGDIAIKESANKLKSIFRENDIVGRFGGDEFIVFMKAENTEIDIEEKCIKIGEMIDTTYTGKDVKVRITASIGVALVSDATDSYEVLFEKADQAVYVSKENGKNTFTIAEVAN